MSARKYLPDNRSTRPKLSSTLVSGGTTLPPKYNLRRLTDVYDQGDIGSCTANAFCAAYRLLSPGFQPSRLWVYYYERLTEDPLHNAKDLTDSGADIVDGLKYVREHGVCSEALWPYNTDNYNVQPPAVCAADAAKHKIAGFMRITPDQIRIHIHAGTPVNVAIDVYKSFEDSVDGNIPLPLSDDTYLGGHELCITGYDDTTSKFEVLNSWGNSWGDNGYCYIPYDYIFNPELCRELTVYKL